jgi:hypothetical protein
VLNFASAARWQSGDAAACKAVYSGSIPLLASRTPVTTHYDPLLSRRNSLKKHDSGSTID